MLVLLIAISKKSLDISCGYKCNDEWHKYYIPQSVYLSTVAFSTKELWANNIVRVEILFLLKYMLSWYDIVSMSFNFCSCPYFSS